MGKHRIGGGATALILLVAVLAIARDAKAAGDWEWTANQGWVMGAGVSRPTPKEQLAYAYEVEEKGEFMDAARQYFLLVQNFPESQEAGVGLQRLARCLFEMENYYTSYKAIEQVIKTYPNTGRMSDLVEIELRIAKRMMLSQTPDILADRETVSRDHNVRRALEIVGSVIEHDPYGPVAAEAYLVKGEGNLFIGEIAEARTAFETVRDEFPRSDFVERARLGILRCDSLVGQARPQELAEQADVVREEENRRRSAARDGDYDDIDDVEQSLRNMEEVEAAKMMEQAEVYHRMGTRAAVKSSQFLYKEIARRYPRTPQAEEAKRKLGGLKLPSEPGRITTALRNINVNPFTWNKDPEPPWIVPQLDPQDMVMIDAGLGPIAGVPETGTPPPTSGSASVRPAGLSTTPAFAGGEMGYSPIEAAPGFIDGGVGGERTYSSGDPYPSGIASAPSPGLIDLEPGRGSSFLSLNNPLPSITESDLISLEGAGSAAPAGSQTPQVHAAPTYEPSAPPVYSAPGSPPSLGGLEYNAPLSDLVGPAPRGAYSQPPASPSYYDGQIQSAIPQPRPVTYYEPYPAQPYQPYQQYQQYQQYQPNQSYQSNQPYQPYETYQQPYQDTTTYQAYGGLTDPGYPVAPQGGWTLGEDFR